MSNPAPVVAPESERVQTRMQALAFVLKAWVFRCRRMLKEVRSRPPRLKKTAEDSEFPVLAESRGWLYTSENAAEFTLQSGKVQNLRVAAARLDGLVIPAGEVFSIWRNLPRPTRRHGFVPGRELREGCIIPSVGGGLCQLSNAFYDAALQAGCEIVERHAHSQNIPGSMAQSGRDATIFWNYVDLRFRPVAECRLEVHLTRNELVVRLRGQEPVDILPKEPAVDESESEEKPEPESCETCGITSCFRHLETSGEQSVTAWLVDAWTPEFDGYVSERRTTDDWLFLPLQSSKLKLGNYRWNTAGFGKIRQAPLQVVQRSIVSRRLASQGAARQKALLRFDGSLARRFAKSIPAAATHLVVAQNLLPFLWREGVLGGRTFDVMMTRFPIENLQSTLDRAAKAHSESTTLADFRADPDLASAEAQALAAAKTWITPHSAIAALAGERARKLDWNVPPVSGSNPSNGDQILFPASTLGRKGAYELREAARELGFTIRLGGPVLESDHFWDGIQTEPAGENLFSYIRAVALPAWVEHQPRRLLHAVAAGIPVIASDSCGLADVHGVTTIPTGDASALLSALRSTMEPQMTP